MVVRLKEVPQNRHGACRRAPVGRAVVAEPPSEPARLYRELFGWTVERVDGHDQLRLTHGMAGVLLHPSLAATAVSALKHVGACGPVLLAEDDDPAWIVLADPNGVVLPHADLPLGIGLLDYASAIQLPRAGSNRPRWVVPPTPGHRWLPTIAAVISATGAGMDVAELAAYAR